MWFMGSSPGWSQTAWVPMLAPLCVSCGTLDRSLPLSFSVGRGSSRLLAGPPVSGRWKTLPGGGIMLPQLSIRVAHLEHKCVHAHAHAHMQHMHTHTTMHTCPHAHAHTHMRHVHTCPHAHTYAHMQHMQHMHTCPHAHARTHMTHAHVPTCSHTRDTHTCPHAHIHVTHAHMPTCSRSHTRTPLSVAFILLSRGEPQCRRTNRDTRWGGSRHWRADLTLGRPRDPSRAFVSTFADRE